MGENPVRAVPVHGSVAKPCAGELDDRLDEPMAAAGGRALVALDGTVIAADADFAGFLGHRSESLVTHPLEDLVEPEDRPVARALFHRAVDDGRDGYRLRQRCRTAGGARRWAALAVDIVRDRQGEPCYCVARVSPLPRAERTGRTGAGDGDRRLHALTRNSEDLIALIDEQTRIRYSNPAATELLGGPPAAPGARIFDHVHPDDQPLLDAALARLRTQPGPESVQQIRVVNAEGESRVIRVVASSALDDPAVDGIVVNARDITELHQYLTRIEASLEAATQSLAMAVEFRDPYTAGHQRRVATLSAAIATEMGLDASTVRGIGVAAGIHDVGKIAVPAELLNRPGTLSETEHQLVREHVLKGFQIIEAVPFPWPVADMVLQHHERLDGSGYPFGLSDPDILLGSRVLAVADTVEAMASHRPYRAAKGLARGLEHIEAQSGVLFDPEVVAACLRLFRRGKFNVRTWDVATEQAQEMFKPTT
ncbi:MAG TPA: HD domain-containing phosphohydrolase [Acidimicrobiales bacterium]|nr:HD domain-containing phosphohydrolase [Acidimicrobiales bacterium]